MPAYKQPAAPNLSSDFYKKSVVYAYGRTLATLALYFALLGCARFVHTVPQAVLLFAAVGFVQYHLYFPLHDSAHYTLFQTRLENRFFGHLLAGLLYTSFHNFREEHMKHHEVYGTQEDAAATDYWVHFRSRGDMLLFLLCPLWGATLMEKIRSYYLAPAQVEKGKRARPRILSILGYLFWPAVIQGGVAFWVTQGFTRPWTYFAYSLLPAITIFLFFSRLRMFLEHGSLDYKELDYNLGPRAMARTIPSVLPERMIFCGLNFNYHYEHHLYPQVPSVQLPRLFGKLTSQTIPPVSYSATYVGSLRKLWKNLGAKR